MPFGFAEETPPGNFGPVDQNEVNIKIRIKNLN